MTTETAKKVFVLGAGFSAPSGAPVVHNFLDRSNAIRLGLRKRLDRASIGSAYERVFGFRNDAAVIAAHAMFDINNIETLFSLLELQSEYLRDKPPASRLDMVRVIVDTLERSSSNTISQTLTYSDEFWRLLQVRWQMRRRGEPLTLYQNFLIQALANCGEEDEISFISFNYDTLLEEAMISFGSHPDYGLPSSLTPGSMQRAGNALRVHKLHGSANWLGCSNSACGRIPMQAAPREAGRVVEAEPSPCGECEGKIVPLIVPPTWNKGAVGELLKGVWQRASLDLRMAREIYFIGYSLPEADLYFRYILGLALGRNDVLSQIYVVDRCQPPMSFNQILHERFDSLLTSAFRSHRLNYLESQAGFSLFVENCTLVGGI